MNHDNLMAQVWKKYKGEWPTTWHSGIPESEQRLATSLRNRTILRKGEILSVSSKGEDYYWKIICNKAEFEAYGQNLQPLNPEPEKWMPEVGQECECESGYTDSGWKLCTFEGSTRVGNVISSARKPLGKLISKEVKFRPLKTEREKFVEQYIEIASSHTWSHVEFPKALYDKGARFTDKNH